MNGPHSSTPIDLDALSIASPCDAKWDEMKGDDRSRHCAACRLDVFDLSAMTRDEAIAMLNERAGKACLRLHRRSDGRVITQDCPVGLRRALRRTGSLVACLALGVLGVAFAGWASIVAGDSTAESVAKGPSVAAQSWFDPGVLASKWDAAVDRAAHATGMLRFCRCRSTLLGSVFIAPVAPPGGSATAKSGSPPAASR